ncbi:hypothetical protein GGU11DRAFT_776743 [Lentinula aff. detonsa]|nr:hypothetical protein GGU11DRAFT_776743 [Lentinula aff. detonsa]
MSNEMFIPPLGTPQPSPRNPPVLPGAANATPSAWSMPPAMGGQYMFTSPMMGTPYIPPHFTPASANPAMLPRGTPYGVPQSLPDRHYTIEYTGYPDLPPTPQWGPMAATQLSPAHQTPPALAHQLSPWAQPPTPHWAMPNSAPPMGGTPWQGMNAMLPGGGGGGLPPNMMHPQSANPWGMPAMLPPQSFGPPQMQAQGMGPPMMPPGAQQMQGMGPPMMPPGAHPMGMMGGDPWDMSGMNQALGQPTAPLARATGVLGDRMDVIDEFAAGAHYGPVLEPFLTHVLHVVPKLNPLIKPAPLEPGDPDHDYLKWNMLWGSNMVQRSSDSPQTSWSSGRDNPATFPRITSLRLLPNLLPFTIDVFARNPDIGVTCGDIVDAISDSMRKHCGQADFDCLTPDRKRKVSEAYRHNRSRTPGVPGGSLGGGIRRMDFLGMETMFGGLKEDPATVRRICGESLPCTWVMDCTTRYPMTREEMAAQAAREEALRVEAEAQEQNRKDEEARSRRSRRSSRAPTVETVTDEDDRSSIADTVRG